MIKSLDYKIERNEKESLVNIKAQLSYEDLSSFRDKALSKLKEEVEVDGFRKGSTPEDIIIKKVGEQAVLQESASFSINEAYIEILEKEKIKFIGYPSISITKLAKDNPLEFLITITAYPEFDLPDYKKIAKGIKKEKVLVKEEDINGVMQNLIGMQNKRTCEKDCTEEHSHKKEEKELTLEFIQTLGEYKSVEEFKKRLKEDITKQKENESVGKNRENIALAILEKTKFNIPDILIEAETEKIIAQMKDDSMRMGLSFDDYLKNNNKTEDDLKKEYKGEGEKRAKIEVILKKISEEEKLKAPEDKVNEQVKTIKEMHKDADLNHIKVYVENILINEKVMQFLEEMQSK